MNILKKAKNLQNLKKEAKKATSFYKNYKAAK